MFQLPLFPTEQSLVVLRFSARPLLVILTEKDGTLSFRTAVIIIIFITSIIINAI